MSKSRRMRPDGRNAGDQYINVPYSWIHSPAWRSLSGVALKVFLELHTRYNGSNNGKLILSYAKGSKLLGIGKSTLRRAFDELQEKGFIRRAKKGYFYGRQAQLWIITDKACDGYLPTNDWKQWRPKTKDGTQTEPIYTPMVPL